MIAPGRLSNRDPVTSGVATGTLAHWLSPMDVDTFVKTHLNNQPYARPGAANAAVPLLQWDTFVNVLRSKLPLNVLTVKVGQMIDAPRPRSLAAVNALMQHGVSVVVRGSERHDCELSALASSFEDTLPGEAHVQLYATPAGTHSFGWHYDLEEVFIVQTMGAKNYYFRDNTVARDTVLGDRLDFTVFQRERSPMYSTRLLPGAWLYIPNRWWHLVKCVEESLSISIGIIPPEALRRAKRIPTGW